MSRWICLFLSLLSAAVSALIAVTPPVVVDLPDGAIQPCMAVDGSGALCVLYYRGDPMQGDLFFARREAGAGDFSDAVRVNHRVGAAAAFGVVGAAQMALGTDGRVHVVWVGSRVAARGDGWPDFRALHSTRTEHPFSR